MSQNSNIKKSKGGFVFSLDFELMWGVRDKRSIASYGANILGVRQAIPRMLEIFEKHKISATWATVGLLFFENKEAMLAGLPDIKPEYHNANLSAYGAISDIGEDEKDDPYHFAPTLIRQIGQTPKQEIGSHSFSHIYSLEPGMTNAAFRADIEAAVAVASTQKITMQSYVFPRNQINLEHVQICKSLGINVYRGTEQSHIYNPANGRIQNYKKRLGRLADTYVNVSGENAFTPTAENEVYNVPSSRFLRPYSPRLGIFESRRIDRILKAMETSAKKGVFFHAWTHPHNFGLHQEENFAALHAIVSMANRLNEEYGWPSYTMADAAKFSL